MRSRWLLLACVSLGWNCAEASRDDDTADAASSGAEVAADSRNVCRLLTADDLSAFGLDVALANVEAEGSDYSECTWENADGMPLLNLKVYWSGGRQQWETWRLAQGLGAGLMERAEGVTLDSIVSQGPVEGLGDAAWFSPLLPSLILHDDVLLELIMPLVQEPSAIFRPLGTKLLEGVRRVSGG